MQQNWISLGGFYQMSGKRVSKEAEGKQRKVERGQRDNFPIKIIQSRPTLKRIQVPKKYFSDLFFLSRYPSLTLPPFFPPSPTPPNSAYTISPQKTMLVKQGFLGQPGNLSTSCNIVSVGKCILHFRPPSSRQIQQHTLLNRICLSSGAQIRRPQTLWFLVMTQSALVRPLLFYRFRIPIALK